jgi:branched-chain amino acid transport system permease protein
MKAFPGWSGRMIVWGLLALGPFVLSEFGLFLVPEILILGLLAASLDLLVGFTGLPSLGHATYFGVGGYAAALFSLNVSDNALLALAISVAAAGVVAVVTGWLAVRTRGVYFLMLTLAFAQLLFSLAVTWDPVTGGSNGLAGIPRASLLPGDDGTLLSSDASFYYYVLIAFILGYSLLRRVVKSPFGLTLEGIRENEARMRSVGYSTVACKLGSFVLAGGVAGYAGALFVQHERFISPSNVAFEVSALALIMVIVGGTLYGPVLGAAIVLLLRDELSRAFLENWRIVLGLIFIAIVYLLPHGVAGAFRSAARFATDRLRRMATA